MPRYPFLASRINGITTYVFNVAGRVFRYTIEAHRGYFTATCADGIQFSAITTRELFAAFISDIYIATS